MELTFGKCLATYVFEFRYAIADRPILNAESKGYNAAGTSNETGISISHDVQALGTNVPGPHNQVKEVLNSNLAPELSFYFAKNQQFNNAADTTTVLDSVKLFIIPRATYPSKDNTRTPARCGFSEILTFLPQPLVLCNGQHERQKVFWDTARPKVRTH